MTKGLPRSLSRGPRAQRMVVKESLQIDVDLSFTGATGVVVFATAPIAFLEEGNVLLLGAVANLTFSGPTSANLTDDFQGDYSLGSTATDDITLDGTDVDVIGSTAIPAATAEVSANVRGVNAAQAVINNTAAAGVINLNVLLDADEVTDAQTVILTVTGTVDIAYIVLGDD